MSADETDAKFHPLETDLQSDTAAATSTAAASRSPSLQEKPIEMPFQEAKINGLQMKKICFCLTDCGHHRIELWTPWNHNNSHSIHLPVSVRWNHLPTLLVSLQ